MWTTKAGIRQRCLLLVLSCIAATDAIASHVSVLENPPGGGTIAALGQLPAQPEFSTYYFAQSFTVPEAGFLRDLSFQLRTNSGPGPTNFRVLVTDVAMSSHGIHPNRVFFESETLTLPDTLFAPPTTFTVDLGLLRMNPNWTYAFVLDSFVTRQADVFGSAQAIGGFGYDGGRFFALGAPYDGDRASHFASDWQEFPEGSNVDMAFSMTFVVAEPPSISLVLGLGLMGGGAVAIRRRRSRNSRQRSGK